MRTFFLRAARRLLIAAIAAITAFLPALEAAKASAEPAPAEQQAEVRPVEVFDVVKGKIVKKIPYTPQIQKEVTAILGSVDGLVTSLKIDPKKGIALRVPVDPAVQMNQPFFKDQVSDAFIFLARAEKPYMLLFTRDNKPVLVHFKHDVQQLINLLQIQDLINAANEPEEETKPKK